MARLPVWTPCAWKMGRGGQPIDDMKVSGQVRQKVAAFLFADVSKREIDEAINRAVNEQIKPLVKADVKNPFGSKWGELTARIAADTLGISLADARNQLATSRPTRVKTEQGLASGILKRRIRDKLNQNDGLDVAQDIKLTDQIRSWELRAKELGCNRVSARKVAGCMVELLATQTEFGQPINLPGLLISIAKSVVSNTGMVLDVLRCPPQKDSETEGILVCPKLRFETRTASGKKAVVDQEANLAPVKGLLRVLEKWQIPVRPKVTLVDIDAFVLDSPNREQGVSDFETSFALLADKVLPRVTIEKTSDQLGVRGGEEFLMLPRVKRIIDKPTSQFSEKHVEKVVDDIFVRLQERNLPAGKKTREAARDLAKKRLALEFEMGARLSDRENTVFVQRARTTSAMDTFVQGAKSSGKKPVFLLFWNERVVEE